MLKRNLLLTGIFLGTLLLLFHSSTRAEDDRVVVKVGNETITEGHIKRFLEGAAPVSAGLQEADALKELIVRSIMYQEAVKKGIDKREDVREQISAYEHNMIVQALMKEESLLSEPVTEEMARDLYEKNWMDARYPRWVSVTMFKINFKKKELEKEAREYAENLREKIQCKDFESDLDTALEKLKKDAPVPDGITLEANHYNKLFLSKIRNMKVLIEQVVLGLKECETSEPIRNPQQEQFTLLNLTKEYPREEVAFEKIKSDLMLSGARLRQQEKMQVYFEKVKDNYKIEFISK